MSENPSVPSCIDLAERFGHKYRVTYEESYYAQYGPHARVEDPALMIIPCRFGHFYPFGGTLLAASVDGHPNVAGVLRRLPCCRVHQDGDFGELTVVFDAADFATVAKIMKPRRRRQVSAPERERLREIGFQKGSQQGSQLHSKVEPTDHHGVETVPEGLGTNPEGPGDSGAPGVT